jgi:hypothetical protein
VTADARARLLRHGPSADRRSAQLAERSPGRCQASGYDPPRIACLWRSGLALQASISPHGDREVLPATRSRSRAFRFLLSDLAGRAASCTQGRSRACSSARLGAQACRRSDCMTSGTRWRRSCWPGVSTRRWSATCWATPPSRSRWNLQPRHPVAPAGSGECCNCRRPRSRLNGASSVPERAGQGHHVR